MELDDSAIDALIQQFDEGDGTFKIPENSSLDDFLKVAREYKESDHWFQDKTELALIFSFCFVMVLGLTGNVVVCVIILRNRAAQSSRNWYILNLALSDILTCVLCKPLILVRLILKNWFFGRALCKLVPSLQTTYVIVSTLTILALAVDRYRSIVNANRDDNKRLSKIIIPGIWVISFVVSIPIFIMHEIEDVQSFAGVVMYSICREKWFSHVLLVLYTVAVLLIQYVSPVVAIVTLHIIICRFLRIRINSRDVSQREVHGYRKRMARHRKNVLLLCSMAIFFVLTWLPLTVVNIMADINYRLLFKNVDFPLLHALCMLIAFFSVCVNPVIYGWFNSNFKRDLARMFRLRSPVKCSMYVMVRKPEAGRPHEKCYLISTQGASCARDKFSDTAV